MLTSLNDPDYIIKSFEGHAYAFIRKPFDEDDLKKKIKKAIKYRVQNYFQQGHLK